MQPRFEVTLNFDAIRDALDAWNTAARDLCLTRDEYISVVACPAWISLSAEDYARVVVLCGTYNTDNSRESDAAWRRRVTAIVRILDEHMGVTTQEAPLVFHEVTLVDVSADPNPDD